MIIWKKNGENMNYDYKYNYFLYTQKRVHLLQLKTNYISCRENIILMKLYLWTSQIRDFIEFRELNYQQAAR